MSWVKEIIDSFKERETGSFWRYYGLSWFIFNWKIIFVALFGYYEQAKIDWITNEYIAKLKTIKLVFFEFHPRLSLYPLLLSILLVLTLPFISGIYSYVINYAHIGRQNRENKQKINELVSKNEARTIKARNTSLLSENSSLKFNLDREKELSMELRSVIDRNLRIFSKENTQLFQEIKIAFKRGNSNALIFSDADREILEKLGFWDYQTGTILDAIGTMIKVSNF